MPKAKTKAASANTYAVLGSDEAEIKRVASELASNLTPPGAGDFGLEVIDGAADNVDQAEGRVRSAIEALQKNGAKKLALATPFPDNVNALVKDFLEKSGFEILSIRGQQF